ncbi:MAG: type III-A CRISPR-associated protein Cas10/Csm1 [Deltaproteobacteria bacterium]|nr:type III-A CRISPR-associated protein Cas10/Csm1 [Deltaproteobacteria bacterium]
MDDTTLKISIAAFMHDVGKFAQACMDMPKQYAQNNAGNYQPFNREYGKHTHIHALYTAFFIEEFERCLPPLMSSPKWGEGDAFVNLAAGHHNPDTPLQWIVTQADRLSSGLDRDEFTEGPNTAFTDYLKTRMVPILSSLGPKQHQKFNTIGAYSDRIPLQKLHTESIFPVAASKCSSKDPKQEYADLFARFSRDLESLKPVSAPEKWLIAFDSLCQSYWHAIPAARVGRIIPDISLYDHAKTTSALAAALYLYHRDTGTLEKSAITDNNIEKFQIISGDFYGIQSFIFAASGERQKYRAKILRGRSFAVSLMADLAADLLCRELGIPATSILMNAAGKFHILAPNTTDALQKTVAVKRIINDWLVKYTMGECSIGITTTMAKASDFTSVNFINLWDRIVENQQLAKTQKIDFQRYGGTVQGYLDKFKNDLSTPLCPLCGKRPAVANPGSAIREGDCTCRLCRDHVWLGEKLVKYAIISISTPKDDYRDKKGLQLPIFDQYQIHFVDEDEAEEAIQNANTHICYLDANTDGQLPFALGAVRLMNGHVPTYSEDDMNDIRTVTSKRTDEKSLQMIDDMDVGAIKSLGHIGMLARKVHPDHQVTGIEAIGALKADIDNLGLLFGCGLAESSYTISRTASISRQIANFFTLYISNLLSSNPRYKNVYTIFSGGDDLFLLGPWNVMPQLALDISQAFGRFVGGNPEITLSAGISVHKPGTPISQISAEAKHALELSKQGAKNQVTMFGETVNWQTFSQLLPLIDTLNEWLQSGLVSRGVLHKFKEFIEDEKAISPILQGNKVATMADLNHLKWRAMFRYVVERHCQKKDSKQKEELGQFVTWLGQFGGAMKIPVWTVLYDIR